MSWRSPAPPLQVPFPYFVVASAGRPCNESVWIHLIGSRISMHSALEDEVLDLCTPPLDGGAQHISSTVISNFVFHAPHASKLRSTIANAACPCRHPKLSGRLMQQSRDCRRRARHHCRRLRHRCHGCHHAARSRHEAHAGAPCRQSMCSHGYCQYEVLLEKDE